MRRQEIYMKYNKYIWQTTADVSGGLWTWIHSFGRRYQMGQWRIKDSLVVNELSQLQKDLAIHIPICSKVCIHFLLNYITYCIKVGMCPFCKKIWKESLNSDGQQLIPPISTSPLISNLWIQKDHDTWRGISMPWLGTGTKMSRWWC